MAGSVFAADERAGAPGMVRRAASASAPGAHSGYAGYDKRQHSAIEIVGVGIFRPDGRHNTGRGVDIYVRVLERPVRPAVAVLKKHCELRGLPGCARAGSGTILLFHLRAVSRAGKSGQSFSILRDSNSLMRLPVGDATELVVRIRIDLDVERVGMGH